MSKKVVTFGEIMLRLAPEGYYQICAGRDIMEQHTAAARQTWQFL